MIRVRNAVSALFNIEPGEGRLLASLLGLSFCLGLSRLFTQTAAGTLFLMVFGIAQLPLVYIAIAITIPVLGLIYDRLGGRLALPQLLLTNLGGLALVLAILWLNTLLTDARWPAFALAVWYEVVWVMTSLCLWGLAGSLLNVRQGKRLFGLISASDVLAATLGGLLTPALVDLFGTPSLLLAALAGLLGAALMVRYTTRTFAGALTTAIEPAPEERGDTATLPAQRRYMVLVMALAMLSYVGLYFVDNLFYGQVEVRYPDENALASFLGVFWAVVNLLMLIGNLFLVGPLFGRYGVRGGLLVLPIVIGVPALTLALAGSLADLPALVFWLVATINLLDWVFRESIQKAGMLILYQPLPASQRLRLQVRVESIGQPIAQGLAGLALLLLGMLAFGVLQLTTILVVILAVGVALTLLIGRNYARVLVQALVWRRFGGVTAAPTDSESVALVSQGLNSPHAGAAIYALDVLGAIGQPALIDGLRRALGHPAREVRREALARIERLKLGDLCDVVRRLALHEPDLWVRGAALRALAALDGGAFDLVAPQLAAAEPELRFGALVGLLRSGGLAGVLAAGEHLIRLAQSPVPADRALAAQTLGEVGIPTFYQPLIGLLGDAELLVRRAAITAAGQVRSPRLVSLLIGALSSRDTRAQAAAALAQYGDVAVPELAAAYAQPGQPRAQMIRLLRVVGRIGGPRALALNERAAGSPDPDLRHEALLALNRCDFHAEGARREQIQGVLTAEIAEMANLLCAQVDLAEPADGAAPALIDTALQEAVVRSRERLLLVMACLYDARTIGRVRDTLAHPAMDRRAYALEVLDNLLAQEHRPLIALFSDDQPPAQRLKRLPQAMQPPSERRARLRAIAGSAAGEYNSWLRMCAQAELARTTAANGLVAAQPEQNGASAMLSLIERVLILKTVSTFAGIPDGTLAEAATLLEEQDLAAGETLFTKGEPGRCMYIIVAGRVRVHDGGRLLNELGERDIFGEMAVLDSAPRLASVEAAEATRLLRLDQDALYELMADHVEVARGIIQVLSGHLRARVQDIASLRAQIKELEEAEGVRSSQ
jgi:HEAT repeat protein